MAEREVILRFRVVQSGFEVLDQAGNKIGVIGAEAKQAERSLDGLVDSAKRAERGVDDFVRGAVPGLERIGISAAGVGAAVGAAIAGGFTLAGRAVGEFLQRAGQLNDLSQSVGIAARDLSSLTLAAKTSGVEMAQLGQGLKFLNINIASAAAGSRADAEAFKSLGVEVRTGRGELRAAVDVLEDIAGAFERLPDGPEKTARAVQIFGRAGAELIPVLNNGRDGLRDMREEAIALGLVFENDTVKRADDVGDAIDKLKLSGQGLANSFAQGLLPEVEKITGKTLEWRKANGGVLNSMAELVGSEFGAVVKRQTGEISAYIAVAQRAIDLGRAARDLLGEINAIDPTTDDPSAAGGAFRRFVSRARGRTFNDVASGGSFSNPYGGPQIPGDQVGPIQSEQDRAGFVGPIFYADKEYQDQLAVQAAREREDRLRDEERRRRQAAGGGRGADSEALRQAQEYERAVADGLAQREKERLALLDLQVTRRETALSIAQEDLAVAQRYGATQQDQLAIAQRIDALDEQRLAAARERIQTELDGLLQFGPVVSAEVVQLQGEIEAVNAEIARGPQAARGLADEFARAREESGRLEDSFRSVLNALQSSGGRIDIGGLLKGVLQVDATDLFAKSLGGLAERVGIGSRDSSLIDIIGNGIEKGFASVRNLFTISPSVSSTGAAGASFGDVTAGGSSTAASAGGLGGGAAMASIYVAAVLAAIGGIEGAIESAKAAKRKVGATDDDAAGAALGGWFEGAFDAVGLGSVGGIIGSGARGIGKEAALANAWILGPLEGLIVTLLSNAPTRGTNIKRELNELYSDANLPRQRVSERGGRAGVQTQGIESAPNQFAFDELAARGYGGGGIIKGPDGAGIKLGQEINAAAARSPEVANLRFNESLAVGAVLGKTPEDAANITNAITNNLLLLDVSLGEARRQMKKLADTAGIDLVSGLEELNNGFLASKKTSEDLLRLQSASSGLVKLFNDELPAAINVENIVTRATNQTGGIDINAVQWGIRGAVGALNIRDRIADTRLGYLDQRQQGNEIRRRISDIDQQLAAGVNASGDPLSEAQREQLLQRRADYAFQYVDYAGSRFSGSARRRAQEYGYAIAEDTAKQLEQLGSTTAAASEKQTEATKESTNAIAENTRGIEGLTAAIKAGVQGKVKLDVTGLEGEDMAETRAALRRIVKDILTEPEFRANQRENVG